MMIEIRSARFANILIIILFSSSSFICVKIENEFIAKCFITVPPPNADEKA